MYFVIVVNCSQIFCTFAVETTTFAQFWQETLLWIALKFFVLLQSKQRLENDTYKAGVVNCSQIFCTFAVETTDFLLTCEHTLLWIALKFFVLLQSKQLCRFDTIADNCCELLSNFLYFCSRNNRNAFAFKFLLVVNCSQIFCTFAVETTPLENLHLVRLLWIALKFFVLLQSKQLLRAKPACFICCELLSNFLYFCSRNNSVVFECVHFGCELLSNFLYFCSRNNKLSNL